MVSCGNTCNIPVDDPEEFEFDCKEFGASVNLGDAPKDKDQKFHKNLLPITLGGLFAIVILIAIIIMFVKRRKEQSQTLQTQPQSLQTSTSFIYVADPLKPAHPTHPANPIHPTNLTNSTNPTHSTDPTQPTDFPQPYNPCK
ncbi:6344_t:CDS:2 [Funneliformis mosseae]|uniref:6344_t:CDS:1 n=1 Tax=Funneliformis mosseae TaxID=27381 RepID=A0A9N9CMG1_FUNMO|nr:6344_t:CDS:2 [Funneliformis mosseae]